MEVHRILGPGYLESIYRRAMIRELGFRGLPVQTELVADIVYKGEQIGQHRMDLIVAGEVVVELKCVSKLAEIHRAQTISYLKATGIPLGLILNFAGSSLIWNRIIFSKSVKSA
jgi:GxxExxY protein